MGDKGVRRGGGGSLAEGKTDHGDQEGRDLKGENNLRERERERDSNFFDLISA